MQNKQANSFKGRGAQVNTHNPFLRNQYVQEHYEALDEPLLADQKTAMLVEHPKTIINRVESPDIPMPYSMNPYQGCEHGCIYCYARNTHQYWGMSAGLDFERKIIVKENGAELLEAHLRKKSWVGEPIMLSGNTDCYQPVERKLGLTRKMLEVLQEFRNPVGIITKNSLILRDIDILADMAKMDLVRVNISITTLDENLRQKMEPRTASGKQRLKAVEALSRAGIPVSVMIAPVIPGLNNHEIVDIVKAAADHGARSAAYTFIRLNGSVAEIFSDWLHKTFPDKADKVLSQIAAGHGGKLGGSSFGQRVRGVGQQAQVIRDLLKVATDRYMHGRVIPPFNQEAFRVPDNSGQLSLF